jgi:hypothetical protein
MRLLLERQGKEKKTRKRKKHKKIKKESEKQKKEKMMTTNISQTTLSSLKPTQLTMNQKKQSMCHRVEKNVLH